MLSEHALDRRWARFLAQDVQEFVSSPGEHVADTFYFVGDELVMQNKAVFSYENDGEPAFH